MDTGWTPFCVECQNPYVCPPLWRGMPVDGGGGPWTDRPRPRERPPLPTCQSNMSDSKTFRGRTSEPPTSTISLRPSADQRTIDRPTNGRMKFVRRRRRQMNPELRSVEWSNIISGAVVVLMVLSLSLTDSDSLLISFRSPNSILGDLLWRSELVRWFVRRRRRCRGRVGVG